MGRFRPNDKRLVQTAYVLEDALAKVWPCAPIGHPEIVPKPVGLKVHTWHCRVLRAAALLDKWFASEGEEPYSLGLRFRTIGGELFVMRDAIRSKRFWPVAEREGHTEPE